MERVSGDVRSPGGVNGSGSIFIVNHNADNSLITLRYRLKKASFEAAEEPFEAGGKKFNRGSFIIRNASADEVNKAATELGLQAYAVAQAPTVKTHAIKVPRVALLHTWLSTQDEGWWRLAFDQMQIPYDYISTQDVAKDSDLNRKYDVIIFAPGAGNANAIIQGRPMYGNPLPWKKTELTPNLGGFASTDDMRPGLGLTGLTEPAELCEAWRSVHRHDGYCRPRRLLRVHARRFDSTRAALCAQSATRCAQSLSIQPVRLLTATAIRSRPIASRGQSSMSVTLPAVAAAVDVADLVELIDRRAAARWMIRTSCKAGRPLRFLNSRTLKFGKPRRLMMSSAAIWSA